ncbi:MAG TPA: hypothetical protein VG317_19095 [Pseudonocardiaceae bacterium]|jgi:hypothetical protein|nr:hypothetical protein [Pseudonocardiaceae bacterium]
MADHQPESARVARDLDSILATLSDGGSVRSAAAPAMSRPRSTERTTEQSPAQDHPPVRPACGLCEDTGYFRWTQMCPDGVLREMTHPCIHGCGGHWRQPAAENDLVVDVIDSTPIRP